MVYILYKLHMVIYMVIYFTQLQCQTLPYPRQSWPHGLGSVTHYAGCDIITASAPHPLRRQGTGTSYQSWVKTGFPQLISKRRANWNSSHKDGGKSSRQGLCCYNFFGDVESIQPHHFVGGGSLTGKGSSDSLKEPDSSNNSLGLTLAVCTNTVCHLWGGQRALGTRRGTHTTLSDAAPASGELRPKLSLSPACAQALKLLYQQLEMAGPWVGFEISECLKIPNVVPKSGHENKTIYCM